VRHNGEVTSPIGPSGPPGPAGPYQMPPSAAPVAADQKRVSPAGYWIGGGILAVGCGIAIVWFVVTIVGLVDAPNDFERIAVPGSEVVTLAEGDWTIYYESASNRDWSYGVPSVDVTGPNGRSISPQYSSNTYTYDVGGNHGEALYEFHASTPGAYTIETSTVGEPGLRSGDQIAVGRPLFDGGRIAGIVGSLALGAVSFLIGLVVLIVTIVRRSRARRRPTNAPYQPPYGGGPYGGPYGGAYGGAPPAPSGWGPSPGPPAPGWSPPSNAPPAWPPPAPGSPPWPAPGTTPPAPDDSRPPPGSSPWPAPDDRPPTG
jgi:hypothetical protein